MPDEPYTIAEVKQKLRVSNFWVQQRINEGAFKAFHFGRVTRIDRESFDSWYADHMNNGGER